MKHIWAHYKVVDFLTKYQYKKAERSYPVNNKVEIVWRAIENKRALQVVYLSARWLSCIPNYRDCTFR
jgi:hypothetical protein